MRETPATHRYRLIGLLVLLFTITYLDRVCISVAGPRMQADLGIDPIHWGWVTGAFTLAYCLFEIPTGVLGDRLGPRRVLTRIVLWWSGFTALTGAMTTYYPLLAVRFLFGAGEAGAFPTSSVVVARCFPPSQRATMSGVALMASQIGGALSPLIVVPIQMRYGWRASFFVFGALGVVWAAVWYWWFRDTPAEKAGLPKPADATGAASHGHAFPWRVAMRNRSVMSIVYLAICYVYVYNFYQTWFHTFLVKGRGFSEDLLWLSALPYILGACANLAGGAVSDLLVRRLGLSRGRRITGSASLLLAGIFVLAAMATKQQVMTVVFLSLVYAGIAFQQSVVFGVCIDIGRNHAGAMTGLMNTSAQLGGLLGSVLYGYIVQSSGSYDAPFIPMAGALFLGAILWTRIDAATELGM